MSHFKVDSHAFLTRPPFGPTYVGPIRLACLRHAASVHPEPGSNSQNFIQIFHFMELTRKLLSLFFPTTFIKLKTLPFSFENVKVKSDYLIINVRSDYSN